MVIMGASNCVAVIVFTLWARSLWMYESKLGPDLSCVQTISCSRSTKCIYHRQHFLFIACLYVPCVCLYVRLSCRDMCRLTGQILSFSVILYMWIAFMYLCQRIPEFQFTIKSVFVVLKNVGDMNVVDLLSLDQSPLFVGPVSVTVAGLMAKNHGVNRGWNYLRFHIEYYHWKTYFLPRMGIL